jgi:hypothetical protein
VATSADYIKDGRPGCKLHFAFALRLFASKMSSQDDSIDQEFYRALHAAEEMEIPTQPKTPGTYDDISREPSPEPSSPPRRPASPIPDELKTPGGPEEDEIPESPVARPSSPVDPALAPTLPMDEDELPTLEEALAKAPAKAPVAEDKTIPPPPPMEIDSDSDDDDSTAAPSSSSSSTSPRGGPKCRVCGTTPVSGGFVDKFTCVHKICLPCAKRTHPSKDGSKLVAKECTVCGAHTSKSWRARNGIPAASPSRPKEPKKRKSAEDADPDFVPKPAKKKAKKAAAADSGTELTPATSPVLLAPPAAAPAPTPAPVQAAAPAATPALPIAAKPSLLPLEHPVRCRACSKPAVLANCFEVMDHLLGTHGLALAYIQAQRESLFELA